MEPFRSSDFGNRIRRGEIRSLSWLLRLYRWNAARPLRRRSPGRASRGVLLACPSPVIQPSALFKICTALGIGIARDPSLEHHWAIHWNDTTYPDPPEELTRSPLHVINIMCVDISKDTVDRAHKDSFGYGLAVDPTVYEGELVEKSNANALHDGRVIRAPISEARPGRVYQRLVDNVREDAVEDIRIPVFGHAIPFVYRKMRPVADRFSNVNTVATTHPTSEFLSDAEVRHALRLCELLGVDYGELDALRDANSGQLYIVDVNPTPNGPPNHLRASDASTVVRRLADAFDGAFLSQASKICR